ncbi:hypothetical protein E9529_09775 [Blastococcus sp. KM273128]|uniref:hypothetical protein n=1 Tax=Blastococcus sp. KM273128 TaxID=2570314 RepID=UPI001F32307F|nr:hypothetical protein [Blastococcus sp. KM273128]MCF6744563.1 hypothetical protein [Blastococcus sp. KM273128]
MVARVAVGRAPVLREVRAAQPLAAALSAPLTARAPWLTAVLNAGAARPVPGRPAAVVVDGAPGGPPRAAAFLHLRRRGPVTAVTLLGQEGVPLPGGRPPARIPARDAGAAALLADGVLALLDRLHGPWSLRLAGLPLGDPTARALAARLSTAVLANERSTRLVDALDRVGPVVRGRDGQLLERWLPALLAAVRDRRGQDLLRATARLHAATGHLEVAVVAEGDRLRAGLLTLLDGDDDRWPWWGVAPDGGLGSEMGAPVSTLSVPLRRWPR